MNSWYGTNKKLIKLSIFSLISLLLIFFVGREKNAEGDNKLTLTTKGVESFRLGMDIAGGSRLVYKIDYSKYKEQFKDSFQYQEAKQTAENIIFTQIDNRISKLGVSDYSAYPQTLNGEDYVVIELGGVTDVNEAKEKIGKTVELEFKIANEVESSEEEKEKRRLLASSILKQVVASPDEMERIGQSRASEDVTYTKREDVSLYQLPTILQENAAKLDALANGEILSDVLEGVYFKAPEQYVAQGLGDLKGFTLVKMLDKTVEQEDEISLEKVLSVVDASGAKAEKEITFNSSKKGSLEQIAGGLRFTSDELYSGSVAYDVTLYQYETTLTDVEDRIIPGLQSGAAASDIEPSLTLAYEGWIQEENLLTRIPLFAEETGKSWYHIASEGISYILYIREKKAADQDLYELWNITVENTEDAIRKIKERRSYSLEEIYVADAVSWTAASDPKTNELLNGAYFELARTSMTQLGEPSVLIQFNEAGKRIFCHITEENIGKQMAIFVGGELKTNPVIQDKICGGETQISGSFDQEEAKKLVKDLNEGALPAPLILTQEETVSPTLGSRALTGVLRAGLIGFVLIFAYMFFLYGIRQAVVALLVLLGFVVYLGGILKLVGFVISLSGLAAIILTLGMSIDANILIFERLREEKAKKQDTISAIAEACSKSWAPIRDGNISTGIIALLLFTLGVNVFKGFGSMMIVSIILILFAIVPLTRELLKKMIK